MCASARRPTSLPALPRCALFPDCPPAATASSEPPFSSLLVPEPQAPHSPPPPACCYSLISPVHWSLNPKPLPPHTLPACRYSLFPPRLPLPGQRPTVGAGAQDGGGGERLPWCVRGVQGPSAGRVRERAACVRDGAQKDAAEVRVQKVSTDSCCGGACGKSEHWQALHGWVGVVWRLGEGVGWLHRGLGVGARCWLVCTGG